MLERQSHPALRQRSRFRHNVVLEEMEAAAMWGVAPTDYWLLSRDDRKVMTATLRARRIIDAISAWDSVHKSKR